MVGVILSSYLDSPHSLTLDKYLVKVRGAGRGLGYGVEGSFEGDGGFEEEEVSLSYTVFGSVT
jgi:hypothetical protein